MKKTLFILFLLLFQAVSAQFAPDLVLQLHSGTNAEMNSMNVSTDITKVFYNTTDNLIYYHDGSHWILLGSDNQNIVNCSLNGTVLTIGIEDGTSETIDLASLKDNLGNHTATTNIETNNNYVSNDGDSEGVFVATNGNVGINTMSPNVKLDTNGKAQNQNERVMVSSNSGISTTSTSFVDVPNLSIIINTADADLLIVANIPGLRNRNDVSINFRITVDGIQVGGIVETENSNNNGIIWCSSLHALTPVNAGSHTIKVQWSTQSGGTARCNSGQNTINGKRTLSVIEL